MEPFRSLRDTEKVEAGMEEASFSSAAVRSIQSGVEGEISVTAYI